MGNAAEFRAESFSSEIAQKCEQHRGQLAKKNLWLEKSFVEPGRLTRLWNLWERERGMLEFKVEEKIDVYWRICGKAREQAKAKCLLRDEKRSQELSGGALELVGSSDDGHEEEVPDAEKPLRLGRSYPCQVEKWLRASRELERNAL